MFDSARIVLTDADAAKAPDSSKEWANDWQDAGTHRRSLEGPVGGAAKRAFDIVLSALAITVLSPVLLVLALAVKATSPGPVLFRHSRVGWNGRPFMCLKFRTMVANAEEVLERHLAADPAAAEEWACTQKLKSDPRVTSPGRLLRRFSLDELPQLFNVLRGDMSLVGPRPVVDAELARFGDASAAYLAARPGITGPWQISGRSDVTYESRVRVDSDYVEKWSLWRDLTILFLTIPAVVLARGSY